MLLVGLCRTSIVILVIAIFLTIATILLLYVGAVTLHKSIINKRTGFKSFCPEND
jgi:hypothetical protein